MQVNPTKRYYRAYKRYERKHYQWIMLMIVLKQY